ncbi:LPXTG-motif cell wall-anchored protein [Arthrobacter pascens]|uniref:LPXTG cell wall anchor domain-containing protein n=1 Tax=Arthrobacter pascens TaxID=1677 RepID=UPI002782192D|nr:LPXTG cell wall anchor domain-containing protein [Arthrobacter pascens]MDQ0636160.1 LPXTG-motif cell wall-anchored protein [Arthrobacter pascens]
MKRVIATVGVAGLGLLTVTAPAFAAENISVCHATKSAANPYVLNVINGNGLNGHDLDTDDIIPPNALLLGGMNWTAAGIATYNNNCVPVTVVVPPVDPPVVEPPAEPPVVEQPADPPVVEQPVVAAAPAVVAPVVVAAPVVAPAAPAPLASSARVPAAAAPVSQGTNQGFNAQTAVGGNTGSEAPGWLAGLGALLAAGLALTARRRFSTE